MNGEMSNHQKIFNQMVKKFLNAENYDFFMAYAMEFELTTEAFS